MSRLNAFTSRDRLHTSNIQQRIVEDGQDAKVYRIQTAGEGEAPDVGFGEEFPDESFLKTIRIFGELDGIDPANDKPGSRTLKGMSVMTMDHTITVDDYLVVDGEKYRVLTSANVHQVRHLKLERVK